MNLELGRCPYCGHSLKDNLHGVDQNDLHIVPQTNEVGHSGSCTYCNICNPPEREAQGGPAMTPEDEARRALDADNRYLPCSRCGKSRPMNNVERIEWVTVKGVEVSFNTHYSRCLVCGEEFEAPGQLDANLDAARRALDALDADDTAPPERECSDKCAHWCQVGVKKPYRHLRSCRACNPYTLSKFMRRAEVEERLKLKEE